MVSDQHSNAERHYSNLMKRKNHGSQTPDKAWREKGQVMFWLPALCFVGISVGYGCMPAEMQTEWESAANQWQIVSLAWLAFLCVDYTNTYRKAATALLLIWSLFLAATDGLISFYPSWGMVPETLAVVAVFARAAWKIHAVQSHQAR